MMQGPQRLFACAMTHNRNDCVYQLESGEIVIGHILAVDELDEPGDRLRQGC
jgi:hypothetical protein